ncbi:excalibur calcium-binding domain-containing protein [Nocardia colli]|uniref:excalibur calcium-binding domain-containing protein n=1 Tax=Nocardia colli TaxID=2545717 RepID=UPI0035E0D141
MSVVAGLLGLVSLAMIVIAVIGLVRGHLDWARLRNRKHAGLLLAASFVIFILTGVIAPDRPTDDAGTQSTTSSATSPRSAPLSTSPRPAPASSVTSTPVFAPTVTEPPTTAVTEPRPSVSAPPVPPTHLPDPLPFVPPPTPPRVVPPPPVPTATSAYYANCNAARAAGAAPIHRGEPGYRAGLDRDNDGIACD